jgi:hypothetical protein
LTILHVCDTSRQHQAIDQYGEGSLPQAGQPHPTANL